MEFRDILSELDDVEVTIQFDISEEMQNQIEAIETEENHLHGQSATYLFLEDDSTVKIRVLKNWDSLFVSTSSCLES